MFGMIGALGSAAIGGGADFGSAMLSQYYNKKNMRDQAKLQYKYAERYALNSPSWNVKGLRAAGLNPILAVSNGVNLGANIPNITNSSPKADIDVPALDALRASNEIDVSKQNAASNATTAESQSTSADANMIRAKADAALKQAQTAQTIQRTKFEGQGKGYKSNVVNDIVRGAEQLSDSAQEFNKESEPYLQNAPESPHYKKETFLGGVQARIDADNEVKRITGKSIYEVSKMSDSEKSKILLDAKQKKFKSRGYHIFTR